MEYGLIGEKLPHSFSKEIHKQFGDYHYELCEIDKQDLNKFMTERKFRGINVTIPYKQNVIPYLDEISLGAEKIGAVNTVVNRNGKLYGYNTDFDGLKGLILKNKIEIEGKKVLILGTGGTSKTAFAVAQDLKASEIYKVSRRKNAEVITYEEAYEIHADADVIINTTPVGMFPNLWEIPIDLEKFPKLCGVIDVIYNPLRTRLVLEAKKRGIPAAGGMYMLVAQAAYAAEQFMEAEISEMKMEAVFENIMKQKENIVLTGMPSSGKTTIGKELAKRLHRKFYDVDVMIEERIGQSIPEFFQSHSESEFRRIEAEVTQELSAINGAVIATGGGTILNNENIKNLRQNGKIYFLNRPLHLLTPTDGRPLSKNADDLRKRYEERYSIYQRTADLKIVSDSDIEDTMSKIMTVTGEGATV